MKRKVMMERLTSITLAAAATIAASCSSWVPESEEQSTGSEQGFLTLSFRSAATKSAIPATDDFYLTVVADKSGPTAADTIYAGRFGDRPAELRANAGTYTVSALSDTTAMPEFDTPVYGDRRSVTIRSGEQTAVSLECKLTNAGLKLSFTEAFQSRFAGCTPMVFNAAGDGLAYPFERSGLDIAYFDSGTVYLTLDGEYLFSKELIAGEIRHLEVDAADSSGDATFSISIDETIKSVADSVKVTDVPVISVSEAKTLPTGMMVSIQGYVIGSVVNSKLTDTTFVKTNIVLADNPSGNFTLETAMPIELKKSADQTALNFANSSGHKLYVTGYVGTLYKTKSLVGIVGYQLE